MVPRKINVKVGRRGAFGVQETLEIQIQFDGINIGNAEAIGHHAVGPAATPDKIKPFFFCKTDQIVGDQIICAEAFKFNNI